MTQVNITDRPALLFLLILQFCFVEEIFLAHCVAASPLLVSASVAQGGKLADAVLNARSFVVK
jgi:hypothetical protein